MNTFKAISKTIVMVSLMLFGLEVYAFGVGEDAIETDSLRITLNDDGTGYVQGKMCDECKLLTVAISANTKAFNKVTEVPLKQAAGRVGKPATIFINLDHTQVTRIVW
jgi:hypothetical protein